MTDKQIIKALECCSHEKTLCGKCPMRDSETIDCMNKMMGCALHLINRQKQEIKELREKKYESR